MAAVGYPLQEPLILKFLGFGFTRGIRKLMCLALGKHCKLLLPLGWESACIAADCYLAIATKKYILQGPLILEF